jgi:ABC-type microcin C transport system duplicated ATPase subunit YejF
VFLGTDELTTLSAARLRPLRARMQMVFQDPFSSLNPRMRVGEIVAEGMQALGMEAGNDQRACVAALMEQVGLRADMMERYPHEFSGGQRQRLAIARALIVKPLILVLDEPTSALDVTIQKQVLQLLQRLQRERGLSYLLITHDVDVIRAMAHHVLVMKDGQIVESGAATIVLQEPQHDYTRSLLKAAV